MPFKMKPRTKKIRLTKSQRNIMYYVLKPSQIKILKLKIKGHTYQEIADMKETPFTTLTGAYYAIQRYMKKINRAHQRFTLSKPSNQPKQE